MMESVVAAKATQRREETEAPVMTALP